ncbi:glycosyltransferase family 4 protein [Curtobacterium sp. PhB136]|uniref:glycosyltransferase family 4 protein n=1 Tax=Curtobacterium sp. PhB136 TaxID=2485181 RepID=UPI001053B700|nr:glycosyltransferase family 4 protein [Curtobacterium sp. PhB136]TCK62997.1 glycosyltransferase involved in cell wall biosynthesis [Curtobacterium sp. PhB136]
MLVSFANHSTAPVSLGGAERSLIRFVEDWQSLDPSMTPSFITKAPRGKFIEALDERGWRYQALRFRGWALPSPQPAPAAERAAFATVDYAAVRAIIAEYERNRPDLVVTNTLVAPWASFAAAVLGIPQAWFVREYGDLDHGLHFQTGRAATLGDIGLFSGAVITNSEAMRDHLAEYIPAEKLSVAYPIVDAERLLRTRSDTPTVTPFPENDPGLRITVVGRVEESKGQHRVIDALGALRERGVTASVCFVGGWKHPGEDQRLTDRARALGVADHVVFAGEQRDTAPFIDAADVCVTPSTIEAFGRTTAEYMTLGRAVVASRQGGSAELVEPGVTGALFDADDTAGLADALAAYAADPDSAGRHGAAAPDRLATVVGAGRDNAAAIERLVALVGTEGYRLPQVARYWFELPGAYASLGATSARAAVGLLASRVRSRSGLVGRVLARPGVVMRKLARR